MLWVETKIRDISDILKWNLEQVKDTLNMLSKFYGLQDVRLIRTYLIHILNALNNTLESYFLWTDNFLVLSFQIM